MDIYRERPIKNRKGPVVLVSKSIEYTFPFSYAYLAGYLRQFGEDVHVLFRPYPQNYDKLVKQIHIPGQFPRQEAISGAMENLMFIIQYYRQT